MSPQRQVDPLGTRFAAGPTTAALVIAASTGALWPLAVPALAFALGATGRPPYGLPPGPAVRPTGPARALARLARTGVGRGRTASGTGAPAPVAAFLTAALGVRPGCEKHQIIRRLLPAATR